MIFRLMIAFLSLCATVQGLVVPIISVEENVRLEEMINTTEAQEWHLMEQAGIAIAMEAEKLLEPCQGDKVAILVGKGYNGANALFAGWDLQQKGYTVTAYLLFAAEQTPSATQKIIGMFQAAGGTVLAFDPLADSDAHLLIDGIVGGIGPKGALGIVADAISWANYSQVPILAVDIPSGLNGNTGEVATVAIRATETITFFFPRIGFFVEEGLDHIGTLSIVNLGVSSKLLSQVNAQAYLITRAKDRNTSLEKPLIFYPFASVYYLSDNGIMHKYY